MDGYDPDLRELDCRNGLAAPWPASGDDDADLDLPNKQARVTAKGGDTMWITWGTDTAHLLPRLIAGREHGPLFLAEHRPRAHRRATTDPRDIFDRSSVLTGRGFQPYPEWIEAELANGIARELGADQDAVLHALSTDVHGPKGGAVAMLRDAKEQRELETGDCAKQP